MEPARNRDFWLLGPVDFWTVRFLVVCDTSAVKLRSSCAARVFASICQARGSEPFLCLRGWFAGLGRCVFGVQRLHFDDRCHYRLSSTVLHSSSSSLLSLLSLSFSCRCPCLVVLAFVMQLFSGRDLSLLDCCGAIACVGSRGWILLLITVIVIIVVLCCLFHLPSLSSLSYCVVDLLKIMIIFVVFLVIIMIIVIIVVLVWLF